MHQAAEEYMGRLAGTLYLCIHKLMSCSMVRMGEYNLLKVIKVKDMGVFMDNGEEGILMPKRFVPPGTRIGDELNVFLIS